MNVKRINPIDSFLNKVYIEVLPFEKIISLVHIEVEQYLNNPSLTFNDETFPSTKVLSGEYYIGGIEKINGNNKLRVCVRCLGYNVLGKLDDYLGLDIWLDIANGYNVYRNTDASVI